MAGQTTPSGAPGPKAELRLTVNVQQNAVTVQADLPMALGRARALAGNEGTVLASGSIYLAGAVRTLAKPKPVP